MMNLNFDQDFQDFKTKLSPGIHKITISDVMGKEANDKPYIEIMFVADDAQHAERFYMTEAAQKISLARIRSLMMTAGLTKDQTKQVKKVEEVAKVLVGKEMFIKLKGEEFVGQNGPAITGRLAGGKFCANEEQELRFVYNKRNEPGDIKYIPDEAGAKEDTTNETKKEDDLPF